MTGVFMHPSAEVESPDLVGAGTSIWRHAHVRSGVRIGEECVIGSATYLDVGVAVGSRVKIQNHAAIFGPAKIGDGVFIGPAVSLTNDRVPRAVNPDGSLKRRTDWVAEGVTVGPGASIGAQSTVLSGVNIGAWAMVGAGALVNRDVPAHTLVVGVPARAIGHVCRCGIRLSGDYTCTCGRAYEISDLGVHEVPDEASRAS